MRGGRSAEVLQMSQVLFFYLCFEGCSNQTDNLARINLCQAMDIGNSKSSFVFYYDTIHGCIYQIWDLGNNSNWLYFSYF